MNKNSQKGFIRFTVCGPLSICDCASFPFGFKSGLLDLIVLVPDHYLSFYFSCYVTYFRFSFRFFKKGSCQLLAKVCA